tara:strand:+ start:4791 stop:6062 length:1272 start_codon:yes stop_codon:yes gene_type:complete
MSRWGKDYNNHPLHKTLEELITNINNDKNPEETSGDASEKRRLLKLLDLVSSAVKNADPELVDLSDLNQINHILNEKHDANAFRFCVDYYLDHYDSSYLVRANDHHRLKVLKTHLDKILINVRKRGSYSKSALLDSAIDGYYAKIEERSQNIEDFAYELEERVASQTKKLEDLTQLVKQKEEELSNLAAKIEGSFNQSQEQRQATYDAWYEKAKDNIKTDIFDKLSDFSASKKEEIIKILESYEVDAKVKHDSILKLHGLVATDSMTAGYVKQANKEKTEADSWRNRAIQFIQLMIGWSFLVFLVSLNTDSHTWYEMTRALPVTLMLLYGAIYSSRQSTLHRENEIRTRWFALEVSAIDPYLESMSNKADDVKEEVSKKLFGMNHLNKGAKNHISESSLTDMITTISKNVVKEAFDLLKKGDK